MAESAYLVFAPSGKRGRFPVGSSVLACARQLGVDIDSVCGGRGICGRCQIAVGEGDYAKHGISSSAASLEPLTAPERKFDSRKGLPAGRRLGCHARLLADAVIDVPPESQVHRQVVRKRAEARQISVDPVVKPYYVEVDKPDFASSLRRFPASQSRPGKGLGADAARYGTFMCCAGFRMRCARAIGRSRWLCGTPWDAMMRLSEIWPGFQDRLYGLAVDVGSTTVAAHLCDLSSGEVLAAAGAMNPQIRFGEDLMSRVSYVMGQS